MISEIERIYERAWASFFWRIAVDTDDLYQRAERLRKEGYGKYEREESQDRGRDPGSDQA